MTWKADGGNVSATLHVLPVPGLADIPALMRNIADEIESGAYGAGIDAAVLAFPTCDGGMEVFGLGSNGDAMLAHYLLARAQRKLERIDLL